VPQRSSHDTLLCGKGLVKGCEPQTMTELGVIYLVTQEKLNLKLYYDFIAVIYLTAFLDYGGEY